MGKLGLGETPTINFIFLTFTLSVNKKNNLSVFNVQIIRLYSLSSWNFYVPFMYFFFFFMYNFKI